MPIKFRCSYCRQFLGISRGRAGGVVDCPSCGRSIRVPGLDGVVEPVPAPELNVRDAKLMRALDELAQWNDPRPVLATAAQDVEIEEEIPQPLAEPVPIEVPLPPEPVARNIPPPPDSFTYHVPAGGSAPAADHSLTVAAALAELNQLAATEQPWRQAAGDDSYSPSRRRRFRLGTVIAISLLLAIAGFTGGYFAAPRLPARAVVDAVSESPVPVANELSPQSAISGRITYKTADGNSLPDRNARVLILPREREGTLKLSPVGFRSADHPADVRWATAALRSLGGDLAFTDDGGQFTIQLPNPGTFQIVVLSNYANRSADEEPDPELIRVLTPYFDQPANLLGRTKVHFGQVRYKGTAAEIWDHSF